MQLRDMGIVRDEMLLLCGGLSALRRFVSDKLNATYDGGVSSADSNTDQAHTILLAIRNAGRMPDLLEALVSSYPASAFPGAIGIEQIHQRLKLAAGATWPDINVRARREALSDHFLICEGRPLVDRQQLRTVLDELLDDGRPARVGVINGVELCGKTWSRKLLQALCKARGVRLVEYDMLETVTDQQPKNGADGDGEFDHLKQFCETLIWRVTRKDPQLGAVNTKIGQYIRRLITEIVISRQEGINKGDGPILISIDSLHTKNVPTASLDLVELLIRAVENNNLADTRLVLFGLERQVAWHGAIVRKADLSPLSEGDVDQYLVEIGQAAKRAMPDADRLGFARKVFAPVAATANAVRIAREGALARMSEEIADKVEQLVLA